MARELQFIDTADFTTNPLDLGANLEALRRPDGLLQNHPDLCFCGSAVPSSAGTQSPMDLLGEVANSQIGHAINLLLL